MREDAHLIAAKDRSGRFSGYYKCSRCVAEFRGDSKELKETAFFFAAHVRLAHPSDKDSLEDLNNAARILRESGN
jgi:hypothetical protein